MRVSFVTSGHDVADARLHRQVAAVRRTGTDVEVLGLGDPAGAPSGVAVRTWRRSGFVSRARRAVLMPWLAQGDVIVTLDPDVALGARLRARLTPRRRRPAVVCDVHEDYALLLRDRSWAHGPVGWVAGIVVRLASRAVRRADLTVVADEHLQPDARRRLVLRNMPDPSMLPLAVEPAPEPRMIYVGDLRPSRGLFAMLDTAAAAPGWRLDLVGPISAESRAAYTERLRADPDLAARVRHHGRLDPRSSWALTAGAWAGLLLLDDTPAFRTAMPSKLYEYLVCGLPVITTDLPRQAAVVRETGAGAIVHDTAEAAAVLRRWGQDREAYQEVRRAATRVGPTYSGELELARFADAVLSLRPAGGASAGSGVVPSA